METQINVNVDFSDDENYDEIDEEVNELPEEEEMDDDFRAYIYSLTTKERNSENDEIFFTDNIKKKKKREKKQDNNKKIVVLDFKQDFLNNDKSAKKTWKSKRLVCKTVERKEYKFKPKKVQFEYRLKKEKKKTDFQNLDYDEKFPSLF
tara:strand:- start:4109 stop:4555 length:447 start_codon:yes stop_codon:yes gene_type:complete